MEELSVGRQEIIEQLSSSSAATPSVSEGVPQPLEERPFEVRNGVYVAPSREPTQKYLFTTATQL